MGAMMASGRGEEGRLMMEPLIVGLCFGTLVVLLLFLIWRVTELQGVVAHLRRELAEVRRELAAEQQRNERLLEMWTGEHK